METRCHRMRGFWDPSPLGAWSNVGRRRNAVARKVPIDPERPWLTPMLIWAINRKLQYQRRRWSRYRPPWKSMLSRGWVFEDARQEMLVRLADAATRWTPERSGFATFAFPHFEHMASRSIRRAAILRGFVGCPASRRTDPRVLGSNVLDARADSIPAPEPDGITDSLPIEIADLPAVLERITPRQREVLTLRFFKGLTLEECGALLEITSERVRQIESKALDRAQSVALRLAGRSAAQLPAMKPVSCFRKCPICAQLFDPRGLTRHIRVSHPAASAPAPD